MRTESPKASSGGIGARRVIAIIVFGILFCTVLELSARVFLPPETLDKEGDFLIDRKVGWRYPASRTQVGRKWFGVLHNELVFKTNNRGLRGERDYPTPRDKKNEVRILCLGDSSTNYLHFDAYPEFLEKQLSAAFPEKKFWVQNAGVAGFSSDNIRAMAEVEIPLFKPDFVVVLAGTCDATKVAVTDREKRKLNNFGDLLARVSQASRLVTAIREAAPPWMILSYTAGEATATGVKTKARCSPAEYRANLLDIARIAKENGAQTLISAVTWLYKIPPPEAGGEIAWTFIEPYREVVRDLEASDSLTIIDPASQLFDRPDRAAFFAWIQTAPGTAKSEVIDNGHLNIPGNEYLAAAFGKALAPKIRERYGRMKYDPTPMNRVLDRYRKAPTFDPTYLRFVPPEAEWQKVKQEEDKGE